MAGPLRGRGGQSNRKGRTSAAVWRIIYTVTWGMTVVPTLMGALLKYSVHANDRTGKARTVKPGWRSLHGTEHGSLGHVYKTVTRKSRYG